MNLTERTLYLERKGAALFGKLVLAVTLLIACGSVHAIPITFTYDPDNSSAWIEGASGLCAGCNPDVVVSQTSTPFSLSAIGESASFDFLTVTAGATGLGGIGFGSANIYATLAFSTPGNGGSSTGNGTVSGIFGSLFFATGKVVWTDQPQNLVFSDGTEISLNFGGGSDRCRATFRNPGGCGNGLSATLAATTTLRAVPEPTQLALLGAGMVGFGAFMRRKKKSA